MAFLQYFSTNMPGLLVSCNLQCSPMGCLFMDEFPRAAARFEVQGSFPKGQQEALQEAGGVSAAAPWGQPWVSLWEQPWQGSELLHEHL